MTWWNRRNTKAITTLVKQIAALTAMLMVLSCAGCATSSPNDNEQSQSSDSSQTHEQVKKSAEQSIDGAHLRDNESLYKVYDDSGVETMYLTVSRGNSSEGTDHSWSEINQYSVDDYAAMGVTATRSMVCCRSATNKDRFPGSLVLVKVRRTPPCRYVASHRVKTSRRTTRSS
mgnify:FL=1